MSLTLSDELMPIATGVFAQVCNRIATLLPGTEVHHVGATAISGALTKGDLDVVVRVEAGDFAATIEKLRTAFLVKQPENWDPYFASFGTDTEYPLPVGVQLVIIDSEADFFLFVRDYLASHPDALAAYNRAKRESLGLSPGDYWKAKDRVLAPIVSLKAQQVKRPTEPVRSSREEL